MHGTLRLSRHMHACTLASRLIAKCAASQCTCIDMLMITKLSEVQLLDLILRIH